MLDAAYTFRIYLSYLLCRISLMISLRNENNRLITSQAKTLVSIVRYKVRNVQFLSFRIILGIAV